MQKREHSSLDRIKVTTEESEHVEFHHQIWDIHHKLRMPLCFKHCRFKIFPTSLCLLHFASNINWKITLQCSICSDESRILFLVQSQFKSKCCAFNFDKCIQMSHKNVNPSSQFSRRFARISLWRLFYIHVYKCYPWWRNFKHYDFGKLICI